MLSDVVEGLSEEPRKPAREKVAVRLSPAGIAEIDAIAEAENRSRSDMIRVLLIEAIELRRRRKAGGR
jgi:hypothetical protein